jgi:hypothetical protein
LEPLTYVPGLVGEVTDWIVGGAHQPNRVFALGAAVTVVGTLASRWAVGPTGSGTHLYVVIVGPAASGKNWPHDAVAKLIEAAGAGVHRGDIASLPALHQVLASVPPAAIVINEITGFLTRAARDRRLADMLCTSWSSTRSSTSAPPFSLFGTARDGEFWPLVQGAKAGREFIDDLFSRFLVFESVDWQAGQMSPLSDPVPAAVKDQLVELHQFDCRSEEAAQPGDSSARFEAQGVFQQLNDSAVDAGAGKPKYLRRVPEQAVRLATIRAAGRAGYQAKVDAADMTWGADLASALVTNAVNHLVLKG